MQNILKHYFSVSVVVVLSLQLFAQVVWDSCEVFIINSNIRVFCRFSENVLQEMSCFLEKLLRLEEVFECLFTALLGRQTAVLYNMIIEVIALWKNHVHDLPDSVYNSSHH